MRRIEKPEDIPKPNRFLSRKIGDDYRGSRTERKMDLAMAIPLWVATRPIEYGARAVMKWEGRNYPDKQPTIFTEERVGTQGKTIMVRKIRTMRKSNYEQSAFEQRVRNNGDPRVTRMGRIIRSMDIDELPQIWQVIKGEMTLFGPRPIRHTDHTMLYTERFTEEEIIEDRKYRSIGKPGLIPQSVVYDRQSMREDDYKMGQRWDANHMRYASVGRSLRMAGRETVQKSAHAVTRMAKYSKKKIEEKLEKAV